MRKRRSRRKRKGGAGRVIATLFLLLLIGFFGISIYLGRSGASRSREEATPRPISLDLPPPEIQIPDAASPTVVVWNGCGKSGLGAKVERWMRRSGFDVFETSNADRSDYEQTTIIIRSGRTEKANRVASFLRARLGVGKVVYQRAKVPESDVLLILGSDFPDSLPDR